MSPFGHLSRGAGAAYSNFGISLLLVFISFAGSWISGSLTYALTESWGILFMCAVLAGKPATMKTFTNVLSMRTADMFLASLIFFGLTLFGTLFLIIVPVVAIAVGIPLFVQIGPKILGYGLGIGVIVAGTYLFFALAWLYVLLRLSFTPYLIAHSGHDLNFAIRHSWETTAQTGLFKIFFTIALGYMIGISGVLFCFVGVFFTWPIFYGTVASLYREVFVDKLLPASQVE